MLPAPEWHIFWKDVIIMLQASLRESKLLLNNHVDAPEYWHNKIEEIEPDEVDLMLLDEIRKNPECHEFVSQEVLMKELEMN